MPVSPYLRLIDSCITQLKAQGPSRTCNESNEEEEEEDEMQDALPWKEEEPSKSAGESATLDVPQGQILSQYPTDATRFWWHLYGS